MPGVEKMHPPLCIEKESSLLYTRHREISPLYREDTSSSVQRWYQPPLLVAEGHSLLCVEYTVTPLHRVRVRKLKNYALESRISWQVACQWIREAAADPFAKWQSEFPQTTGYIIMEGSKDLRSTHSLLCLEKTLSLFCAEKESASFTYNRRAISPP